VIAPTARTIVAIAVTWVAKKSDIQEGCGARLRALRIRLPCRGGRRVPHRRQLALVDLALKSGGADGTGPGRRTGADLTGADLTPLCQAVVRHGTYESF
jgi:hypothetical protein